MAGISFGQNASFKSIVSRCAGTEVDEEDQTIEYRLKQMAGPSQPAMNPTESTVAGTEVVTVKIHPNDDPNWNGPTKTVEEAYGLKQQES